MADLTLKELEKAKIGLNRIQYEASMAIQGWEHHIHKAWIPRSHATVAHSMMSQPKWHSVHDPSTLEKYHSRTADYWRHTVSTINIDRPTNHRHQPLEQSKTLAIMPSPQPPSAMVPLVPLAGRLDQLASQGMHTPTQSITFPRPDTLCPRAESLKQLLRRGQELSMDRRAIQESIKIEAIRKKLTKGAKSLARSPSKSKSKKKRNRLKQSLKRLEKETHASRARKMANSRNPSPSPNAKVREEIIKHKSNQSPIKQRQPDLQRTSPSKSPKKKISKSRKRSRKQSKSRDKSVKMDKISAKKVAVPRIIRRKSRPSFLTKLEQRKPWEYKADVPDPSRTHNRSVSVSTGRKARESFMDKVTKINRTPYIDPITNLISVFH